MFISAQQDSLPGLLMSAPSEVARNVQEVRVNWAFQKDRREDSASQFQIFVGDLASDVNDKTLFDAFQSCGCTDVRVMWDHNTGRSKGYGFVSFK